MSLSDLGQNLLRFKDKQKYLVADTETESLNLYFSRPFQLSYLICEGKNILEKHNYYLDIPNFQISKDAARITKFDQNRYNELKQPPEPILNHFESYLYNKDYRIVGANFLGFDIYQLNNLRRTLNKKPDYSYIDRIIDTNLIQKAILLGLQPDLSNFLAWQYKLSTIIKRGLKTSQTACARHFNIEFKEEDLHDSLKDIELCFKILWKQFYSIEI
jgi:hypothetical protein